MPAAYQVSAVYYRRFTCHQPIHGENNRTNSDWLIPFMIDISHPHRLDATAARAVVQTIADKLAERFEMGNCWEGEALVFSRAGVEGRISLLPGQVRVTAQLGFPYSMMQSMVEEEIQRVLAQRLG